VPGTNGRLGGDEPGAAVLYVAAASGQDRRVVRDRIGRAGLPVATAGDVTAALQMLSERSFTLVVVDLAQERGALASIRLLRARYPHVPVVGVIDPANALLAGDAIHAGLIDVLPSPFDDRDVSTVLANLQDRAAADASGEPEIGDTGPALVAHSAGMQAVKDQIRTAAAGRAGVLVMGEPGSGREVVARALHAAASESAPRPFIVVDCATNAPAELERRLFGATTDRRPDGRAAGTERISETGAIAQSRGGTLFLTHLPEASARVQARLARLFRDREALLTETQELIDLDLRVIASVDSDVDQSVEDGRLRRDLFERLGQVRIDVPPLRKRREDIPVLAARMAQDVCGRFDLARKSFSRSALAVLTALPWKYNASELRDLVEALVRAARQPVIQLEDLLAHASLDGLTTRVDSGLTLRDAKAKFERECISAVLLQHHGRVGDAAKALGIQRTNLYRKVRQLKVARSLLSARR